METPDRDLLIANLYTLVRRRGMHIRTLETSCGVSVGYLARLRQDKKKPLPGTEFLYRAAVRLDTTVDALFHFNFQLATETDQYLHNFVSRLLLDTLSEKLRWSVDSACVPDPVTLESEIVFPDHPLLSLDPVQLRQGNSSQYYASPFHPASYDLVPHAAWRVSISEDTVAFLTRVSPEGKLHEPFNPDPDGIELYLYNTVSKALSPLCHTDPDTPSLLDHDLSVLAETVAESLHRLSLDSFAVSAIDAYMGSC